uniref:Putative structural protein n=1 Tax=viral metagenome TaxID=1070528 RepID=A0A6M3J1D0_9ZZZZ
MAGGNLIQVQVIEDGDRNTVIKWLLIGDNKAGDETDTIVFDASEYKTASLDNKLYKIQFMTDGVSAILNWHADTNIPLFSLPGNQAGSMSFYDFMGIVNNTGSGKTGDILITTNNLNDGDSIVLILYVKERSVPLHR